MVGRERGTGTLEYLGVIVVAALLVGAAVTAVVRFDLAEALACELRSIGTQAGTCGGGDVPTTYDAAGSDDGTVSASRPIDGDVGSSASDEPSTEPDYRNASDGQPAADQGKVDDASSSIDDALDGGFWGVRGGDLDDVQDAVEGLNGAEIDALIEGMDDAALKHWVHEMQDGWFGGGWDREQRRELWEIVASKASRATLDRLATLTDELQPRFDGVGGDGARDDPQSPANSGQYGELDHQLVVDGVRPSDVNQGQIGDCWYVASMMAVAQGSPELIENAITANANGSYTVRLYDDGEPVDITVTPEMVLDGDNPAFVSNSPGDDGYELWPMVLEKALALHWGDYADIEGDSPGLGLELLTGRPSGQRDLDDAGGVEALSSYLSDGGAITLATFPDSDDNPDIYDLDPGSGGLAGNHAYYVSAVDTKNGTVTVTNPWGSSWPTVTMSYADFENAFSSIYFNEVSS